MIRRSLSTRRFLATAASAAVRVLLVSLLGLATSPLAGCEASKSAGSSTVGGSAKTPQPVHVATVRRQAAPLTLRAIGTVEASASVTIRAQVDGRLTRVSFDDGQEVRTGDVLFEIDPRPSQAALRLAEANLARDQAMAADAEREAQRMADLFARDTAADRELNRARADSAAKAAQVRADEAMVEQARLELEYCTIRAPFAGRVGARLAERGDVVRANETPLVVLNQIRPIYVTFSVAETHLDEIRRYSAAGPLTVEAGFPPYERVAERGTLTFTDNRVDRNTGMIRLRGTFANEDGRMWPGQYVDASLILTMRPDAIVVPTKAVQAGPDGQFAFTVRTDRTVEMSPVRIADTLDELSVVESGLTPGQQVVTDGQLRLAPGTEVRVLAGDSPVASQPAERIVDAAAGGGE